MSGNRTCERRENPTVGEIRGVRSRRFRCPEPDIAAGFHTSAEGSTDCGSSRRMYGRVTSGKKTVLMAVIELISPSL